MLAIRLQRTGRSGHSQFRVIVQDSRFSPKRGRVVAYLGSYDPHSKEATIDSEKASQYLQNGARPSDRVARLLQKEGIKLPAWVKLDEPKKRDTRNPEKRRSTAPAAPEAAAPSEEPVTETEARAEVAAENTEATPEAETPEAPATPEQPAETPVEAETPAAPEEPAEESAAKEGE
ncbi:MAG TPA: 30S ribosomal protein S16 [Candidatus Saccharimonadales bacterium]|nr:30S ribosomal protein S16 [Candidatus Saccharimonadales bacterium]